MKVLYLVTRADLGGAQVHVLDLLRGFAHKQQAVVGVGESGYFTDAVRKLGIPYYILPNLTHPISPIQDCRAVADVARLIRFCDADILHAHTSKAGVVGRLAAKVAGIPSVFTAHTWCFAEGISWKWRLAGIPAERIAARCGSAIITVSDANRALALRHRISRPGRVRTIWNGIPDTRHRARPDVGATPVIVMVARCAEQKDQGLLLRAVARMQSPCRAMFIGDGPLLPLLREQSRDLGIRERVEFLGNRDDVAHLLAQSHIFALPTHWEGFPLAILEGMRAGLPVVATDVGGVAEAVIDQDTGFLVPRGDEDAFYLRLLALLRDSTLRRRMGAAGRRSYEARFTVKRMLDQTMDVYQSVARGHRLRPAPSPQLEQDAGQMVSQGRDS